MFVCHHAILLSLLLPPLSSAFPHLSLPSLSLSPLFPPLPSPPLSPPLPSPPLSSPLPSPLLPFPPLPSPPLPSPSPSPSDAIECNRAFIRQYGSDHLPNAPQQFSEVLGSNFNPCDTQNSMYRPLYAPPGMPPATAATVTPKAEPVIDGQFHHPTCPPEPAPFDDRVIPPAMPYPSQQEQVVHSSPPVTPPTVTPMFPNVDHGCQYQPVQTGQLPSMSSTASAHEGYPIGYMTPSPSGSESNSHSHFSPHGTHIEDRTFTSPTMPSYGYHANQDGFPMSTSSRSSCGSQGHLPHMVSMATHPRPSVEDDGYGTEVFSSPTTILPSEVIPCANGLPANLDTMCTIYFNTNSSAYPMATGPQGSYQQPPLYCPPIHETH